MFSNSPGFCSEIMLGRWIKRLLWRPYELYSRLAPIVPVKAVVTCPLPGLKCIKAGNFVISWLGHVAGFDYSVCYVLDESLVVDTGFPWARNALRKTLAETGLVDKIEMVVNTHYHEDHIGNNDLFVQTTKARVFAHRQALSEIKFPHEQAWYRQFLFGPIETVDVQPLGETVETKNHVLEVIDTPGHCPGHVCFYDRGRGWLFSGDLFISARLDSQLADADGPLWIESLDRVIALEPECMFDGHGSIFIGKEAVSQQLNAKREFLLGLKSRIAECAREAQSVEMITSKVFDSHSCTDRISMHEGWLSLLTASDFSRSNLVRSFLRQITSET